MPLDRQEQVVVTGAGAGIGRAFTALLLREGARVLAVGLLADELAQLSREMADHGGRLVTRVQDLSAANAAESLLAWCDGEGWVVDTLINNAGFGCFGDAVDTDPRRVEAMVRLNVITLANLSALFGARMKARGRGGILNVGSTAGLVPIARFAAYGGTKAFVNLFTQALRTELKPHGVTVTCLAPGAVATKFAGTAGIEGFPGRSRIKDLFARGEASTPDTVALAGLRGLRAGKARVVVGAGAGRMALAAAVAPARLVPWLTRDF